MRSLSAAFLVVALGALACAEPVVGVRLTFPSEETFLVSNTITVDVYDGSGSGEQGPDAICRALSVATSVAPPGVQALESSGNTSACSMLDGGVTFTGIEVGRRVFFAEAVDNAGTAILRGCTVADVFGDKAELNEDEQAQAEELDAVAFVDVQLATLPAYPQDVTPTCADVNAKCQENQQCVE